MIPNADNEQLIRRYLLGDLAQDELTHVEIRLLEDAEFAAQVELVEGELLEAYLDNTLTATEEAQCQAQFITARPRQRQLAITRALHRYAVQTNKQTATTERQQTASAFPGKAQRWWATVFQSAWGSGWRGAVAALCVLAIGWGIWRAWGTPSTIEQGLRALDQAYSKQRQVEVRITGFRYAPFSTTRGATTEAKQVDEQAREYAELQLRQAVMETSSATARHALGKYYLTQKQLEKALEQFAEAAQTSPNDALLQADWGAALLEQGLIKRNDTSAESGAIEFAKSLEHLSKALELNAALPEARFNRALVFQALKLTQDARREWESYLQSDARSGWAEEARRNLNLLNEQEKKSELRENQLYREFLQAVEANAPKEAWRAFSLSYFRRGNAIANRLLDDALAQQGHDSQATQALAAIAFVGALAETQTQDRYMAHLTRVYQRATPLQQNRLRQARQLMREAHLEYDRANSGKALEGFNQAQRLFAAGGALGDALFAQYWSSYCLDIQEEAQRSQALLTEVVQVCRQHSFLWLQALALNALASSYASLSEYSTAIDCSRQAQTISQQLEDSNGVLRNLNMLAGLYRAVGRHRDSLHEAQRSLQLADELAADTMQRAGFYSTSAWDFNVLGHYLAALGCQQEALRLARLANTPLAISRYAIHLGLIQRKLGNYPEALKQMQVGQEVGEHAPVSETSRSMVFYAQLNLGHVYRETGASAQALAAFDRVIEYAREKESPWLLYLAHKGRLLTYIENHDVTTAQRELQTVLDLFEEHRKNIQEESNRSSFFDSEQNIYDLAIDFAFTDQQNPVQAFDYAELSRARSLLDAKKVPRHIATHLPVPELRLAATSQPANWEEIRQRIPPNVQVLQYAALEDKLIIWVLTTDYLKPHTVPVSLQQLSTLIQEYQAQLMQPPSSPAIPPEAAKRLYEVLIRPVESALQTHKLLCLIPDKNLNWLSFGTLLERQTNQYLIERYALFYAPSSNFLLTCFDETARPFRGQAEHLLSVGNPHFNAEEFSTLPDLPEAAQEASAITAFYPSAQLLLGTAATRTATLQAMKRATIIHLAAHFVPDARSPMLSKIALAPPSGLAQPGGLAAHELYPLDLTQTRLVVLSACQTGAEAYWQGEGLMGLARTFAAAGVPLVIASLWPVDSRATKTLMIQFHRQHKQAGLPIIPALQAAQLALLRDATLNYRHPYYWASFIAIGGEHIQLLQNHWRNKTCQKESHCLSAG